MISYKVPSTLLGSSDRHDERYYNRADMQISTELQKLPHERQYLLGHLLKTIGTGKGITKEEQGFGDIAFLKVGNIERYYINYANSEVVSEEVVAHNKMVMLQAGDILISRVGTVGNVCMYNGEQKATPSDNILVLRLKVSVELMPFFVTSFLNSPYGQSQIRRLAKQSLQEVINQTSIKSLVIPLPEATEQKAICDRVNQHLEKVRDLRAAAAKEIEAAATVMGLALNLGDGGYYGTKSVDELIGIAKELKGIATKNGSRFSPTPELSFEGEGTSED